MRASSRGSLRQRLVLALVGLSVGSVLLAGVITVVAARPATKSTAISELKRGLNVLYEDDRDGIRPRLTVARLKNQLLANQVGVTAVLANGTLAARGSDIHRSRPRRQAARPAPQPGGRRRPSDRRSPPA